MEGEGDGEEDMIKTIARSLAPSLARQHVFDMPSQDRPRARACRSPLVTHSYLWLPLPRLVQQRAI